MDDTRLPRHIRKMMMEKLTDRSQKVQDSAVISIIFADAKHRITSGKTTHAQAVEILRGAAAQIDRLVKKVKMRNEALEQFNEMIKRLNGRPYVRVETDQATTLLPPDSQN